METMPWKELVDLIQQRTELLGKINCEMLSDKGDRLKDELKKAEDELNRRRELATLEAKTISECGVPELEALQKARVCLLNCGPTGSETVKNLICSGVTDITVVDGTQVEVGDSSNNFMVNDSSIGESKAKCVCKFLCKLNGEVKATPIESCPEKLMENSETTFFSQFTLVVATQLGEDAMVKLDWICKKRGVMLIFAHSHGVVGFVQTSVQDYPYVGSGHTYDLRLNNPWPELKEHIESIDLDAECCTTHSSYPYVFILFKATEEWSNIHKDAPKAPELNMIEAFINERMINEFELNYLNAKKAARSIYDPDPKASEYKIIIRDTRSDVDSSSSNFWVMVAALKEFIQNHGGEPPLVGVIPNAWNPSSEHWKKLEKMYEDKAEAELHIMYRLVKNLLQKISRNPDSISKKFIKSFCTNVRKLKIRNQPAMTEKFFIVNKKAFEKVLSGMEYYSYAVQIYCLIRMVGRFANNHKRLPGEDKDMLHADIHAVKTLFVELLSHMGYTGPVFEDKVMYQICAPSVVEIPSTASVIGGVAASEAKKLITHQRVVDGVLIFDACQNKLCSCILVV